MGEMASRINNLENALVLAQAMRTMDVEVPQAKNPSETPTADQIPAVLEESPSSPHDDKETPREAVLTHNGSPTQYYNDILLSRALAEEPLDGSITSVITPSPAASLAVSGSPYTALGILSAPSFSLSLADLHPPKQVAVRLWDILVNNVDQCAGVKTLHIPTDEVRLYSTIDKPLDAPYDNHALCFAIFYASMAVLDDKVATDISGGDRANQMLKFKIGMEQAFAQGDFLDHPTLTGLHALALYLCAMRIHNRGNGIWVLNGLAMRISESMGLHRDGRRLHLSPFQAEIRRRLWWHFITREMRAGEDYGLDIGNSVMLTTDVDLPLNLEDTDLWPEMTELPPAKSSWTAMSFSLIHIKISQAMQELGQVLSSRSMTSSQMYSQRAKIIAETQEWVEARLAQCNPVIPRHRMALSCSRWLIQKLDFITRTQWLMLKKTRCRQHLATDEHLLEALEILEPRLMNKDDLLEQFAWVRKVFPQYYVSMYILWHLCVKPEGPHVARAWRTVDCVLSGEIWNEITTGVGPKSAVLMALRTKAVTLRDSLQSRSSESSGSANHHESGMGMENWSSKTEVQLDSQPSETLGEDFDFEIDSDAYPDWNFLAQEFEADSQVFLGSI
ncbi:hypothetical protein LTR84_002902 [Exophiala bonariae]|uniref:Xylanolytic transcriptional activator regulatory domain-containing protein n=1 Tax=Exophiala bonariae TaxID=1690606 RepID=A0AAV9NDP3_9EURO|nr:hypothetical protein LTR84_002902 [Exophiala bonariae]